MIEICRNGGFHPQGIGLTLGPVDHRVAGFGGFFLDDQHEWE